MAEENKDSSNTSAPIDKEIFLQIKQNYALSDYTNAPIHLEKIKEDYDNKKTGHEIFSQWDSNGDGILDEDEMRKLAHEYKTTETSFRYGGYGGLAAIFARALRYTAYVSDVGESFRPIIHPNIVNLSYAVSISYVLGDVGYEGYKEYKRKSSNKVIAETVGERFVFQLIASLLVPAFVIHSCVNVGKKIFAKYQGGKYIRWGPTFLGLSVVPLLPLLIDPPVEYALETAKHTFFPNLGKEQHGGEIAYHEHKKTE
jgi:fission process protein 1